MRNTETSPAGMPGAQDRSRRKRAHGAGKIALARSVAAALLLCVPFAAAGADPAVGGGTGTGPAAAQAGDGKSNEAKPPAAQKPRLMAPQPASPQPVSDRTLSFGDVYFVDFCLPAGSSAREWRLSLAGVSLAQTPSHVQPINDGCKLTGGEEGQHVRLGYQLSYRNGDREKWLLVLKNQQEDGGVPASWQGRDGSDITYDRDDKANNLVRLSMLHWVKVLLAILLVIGLGWWLWFTDRWETRRGGSVLRDTTTTRQKYLRTQLERFLADRDQERKARTEFAADLMSKGIANAWTQLTDLLRATDIKEKEPRAAALADQMTANGVENGAGKLESACNRYNDLRRSLKGLHADFKACNLTLPDLLEEDAKSVSDTINNANTAIDRVNCKPPYSLARCQMAWWTIVIIGSVFFMYLITGTIFHVPNEVLYLLGISVTTAGISYAMDVNRPPVKLPPKSYGLWRDITTDAECQATLYRWQVVVWTLLLSAAFVVELSRNLVMTEFDTTLLGLMGISSGTYLGFKWPERTPPAPAAS